MVEQCTANPLVMTLSLHPFVVGQPFRLPPLRRTDDDDDDRYAAAAATGDAPRRNRWVWLVAGLVLLALLGTGLWLAFAGDGEDPAGTDTGNRRAN